MTNSIVIVFCWSEKEKIFGFFSVFCFIEKQLQCCRQRIEHFVYLLWNCRKSTREKPLNTHFIMKLNDSECVLKWRWHPFPFAGQCSSCTGEIRNVWAQKCVVTRKSLHVLLLILSHLTIEKLQQRWNSLYWRKIGRDEEEDESKKGKTKNKSSIRFDFRSDGHNMNDVRFPFLVSFFFLFRFSSACK